VEWVDILVYRKRKKHKTIYFFQNCKHDLVYNKITKWSKSLPSVVQSIKVNVLGGGNQTKKSRRVCVSSSKSAIHTYFHQTFATLHRELRQRRPSKVMGNIYANTIVVYLIFLTGIDKRNETVGCVVSATLLHYFLLTTWCWMATYAYLLLKSLVVVRYTNLLSEVASSGLSFAIVAICRSNTYSIPNSSIVTGKLVTMDRCFSCCIKNEYVEVFVNFIHRRQMRSRIQGRKILLPCMMIKVELKLNSMFTQ